MDFEKELEQLAKEYRDEGYLVQIHPDKDHLPAFAADFGVDLLARRGDANVLVQVKQDRLALQADPNVPFRADITNAQPGWRYDLVVLRAVDPFRKLTREAREPSPEEICGMLPNVEQLLNEGHLQAACVLAWAALEAAMRHVANAAELSSPRQTSAELLRTLYSNGFLTKEEFTHLNQSFQLRSEIVHGLIPLAINMGMVQPVVEATRHLLNGSPMLQQVTTE